MHKFYQEFDKFTLAVDSLVFGFEENLLKLLLINRPYEPEKGNWSLMGGFLTEEENIDDAAKRVLTQLTGLNELYLEQLHTFGDKNRDYGARVISVAYYALIRIEEYNRELAGEYNARWFDIQEVPDLVFDHRLMVNYGLERLRENARTRPIGFALLPEKFSLPQLQGLYEAIYQKTFDKRNFRKKILSLGLLDKLDEKDWSSSKKGAYLYQFNKKRYDELITRGYHFELL